MEPADRLSSWKQIAAYLNVSVRTVQRWERAEGLPARRHKHASLSSVFAYRSELEAWWHSRPDLQAASRSLRESTRSIAVLPFVNLNRDEENEFLSDGLTEELINAFAKIDGLHVAARTSAFHFKGKTEDIRAIGAKLGVQNILEGSIRRVGDRLRITAQLIGVINGWQLWSERFDRQITDIIGLQEEIARAIVSTLRLQLATGRINREYCGDGEVYALYLEGRYHANRRSRQGFLRAVDCFEEAIARCPRMAPAWAGLAECHAFLGPLAGIPAREAAAKAKATALRALEIDDSQPDPYCSLGFISAVYEYDWRAAERYFRQALDLNPRHAQTHLWYGGHVLAPQGRMEEAGIEARLACDLDPLSPPAVSSLGALALMSRKPEQAISESNRSLELDPFYPMGLRWLGEAWLLKNRYEEAADAFSKIDAPVIAEGFLGHSYARCGRETDASQLLRKLEATVNPSPALQIAALHLGLGNNGAALDWLHKASQARSMGVHWLKVEPIWDPLRPYARFAAILKEMWLAD